MQSVQIRETVDRRCLGALRFLDHVTGSVVRRTLNLRAHGLQIITNASHMQVIKYAEGLERHLVAFENPPNQPVVESMKFKLSIQDPSRKYLPRTYTLKLPRRSNPQDHNSLLDPIDIRLYSSASRALSLNWSAIRASVFRVKDQFTEEPLRGALLRATYGQDNLVASGLSDRRGEAVLIVPGIPLTTFVSEDPQSGGGDPPAAADTNVFRASGPVVELQTTVRIDTIVAPEAPWPVDPEELEINISSWRRELKLQRDGPFNTQVEVKMKTGERRHIDLFIKMPQAS